MIDIVVLVPFIIIDLFVSEKLDKYKEAQECGLNQTKVCIEPEYYGILPTSDSINQGMDQLCMNSTGTCQLAFIIAYVQT